MIITASPAMRSELSRIASRETPLTVVALCAAWCNTCAEFREAFAGIAATRPELAFVWLDIEDDAELCGDIDVQSFPTLLAFRGDRILHCGVTSPLGPVVARLVDELATRSGAVADLPLPVVALRDGLMTLARSG